MAKDLILGTSSRNWSRDSDTKSGEDRVIVIRESSGLGFWGWTAVITLGSKVLTGKWPWQLASQFVQKSDERQSGIRHY